MTTISYLDDEVTELVISGQLKRASSFVFEHQNELNLGYITSFIIHRSLYMESLNGLPVSVDVGLVKLAEDIFGLRYDYENEIKYSIYNGDLSIITFLLTKKIVDIEEIYYMMTEIPESVMILSYIIDTYMHSFK